jgi:hypothetical protein
LIASPELTTTATAQGGEYGNALYAALDRGHEAVVKTLLDKGADGNAQGGHFGNTRVANPQVRSSQVSIKGSLLLSRPDKSIQVT